MSDNCEHKHVRPEVCDQTLGVVCCDCSKLLGVCWGDEHFSESLWNRACLNDPDCVKCKLNRDDFCGLCGAYISSQPEPIEDLVEDEDGAPLPESVQKQCREMKAKIDALREEVAGFEESFALRDKADMRAIKMWQAAAPGRELIWPDHADLVVFLLERIDALEDRHHGK